MGLIGFSSGFLVAHWNPRLASTPGLPPEAPKTQIQQAPTPAPNPSAPTQSVLDLTIRIIKSGGISTLGNNPYDQLEAQLETAEWSELESTLKVVIQTPDFAQSGNDFHSQSAGLYFRLLRAMAKIRPQQTAQIALETGGPHTALSLSAVCHVWAKTDPKSALAWCRNTTLAQPVQFAAESAVLGEIGIQNPDALILELQNSSQQTREKAVEIAVAKLATTNPTEGLRLMEAMPPNSPSIYSNFAGAWAMHDPEAALAWAHSLSDSKLANSALASIAWSMSRTQPEIAAQLIHDHDLANLEPQTISQAISQLAESDLETAVELFEKLPLGNFSYPAGQTIFSLLIEENPQAAAKLAIDHPGATHHDPLGQSLTAWLNQDPSAAVAFAQTLEPPSLRARAMKGLVQNWANIDPSSLALSLTTETNPTIRKDMLKHLSQVWLREDPAAAQTWLASVSDPGLKQEALRRMTTGIVAIDPDQAIRLIRSELPQPKQSKAIADAIKNLASSNLQIAGQLLDQIPEAADRENTAGAIATHWANFDPQRGMIWLETLPLGPTRDHAQERFAESLAKNQADLEASGLPR